MAKLSISSAVTCESYAQLCHLFGERICSPAIHGTVFSGNEFQHFRNEVIPIINAEILQPSEGNFSSFHLFSNIKVVPRRM